MPFISKQQVTSVRNLLKPIAAKYGVKFSVSGSNSSTLSVRLQEGKIDFAAAATIHSYRTTDFNCGMCINQYHYQGKFEREVEKFFDEVFEVMRSQGWYDRSDTMTDYFDTAYYMYLRIGAWDKPYVVIT